MIIILDWLIRPGVASIFKPTDGIVQEWITSVDEINIRIIDLYGIIIWLSVSKSRISLMLNSVGVFIYESNSIFLKSEYS